jgi:hypothetical protein
MESIQRAIEPLQDAILKFVKAMAALENNPLADVLADLRKSEKELRDRLFICQVAKKYEWEAAGKMARRKAGEFDDPELAKVLEEQEKKLEKAKRDEAKIKATQGQKRKFQPGTYGHYRGGGYAAQQSPLAATSGPGASRFAGSKPSYQQQNPNKEVKCYLCDGNHYVKFCSQRKK